MSKAHLGNPKVSVVIPNYNGLAFVKDCLDSLELQTLKEVEYIVVDNGSSDGSLEVIQQHSLNLTCISLKENTGFCGAVNTGIKASHAPYVILLNNDTVVDERFVEVLYKEIHKRSKCFSMSAKLIQLYDKEKIDDAGNYYCALGWAFARGKDKSVEKFNKPEKIFSACAGAAIYRKEIFEEIGYFDEAHFAYLEDLDVGYRGKINGYYNYYMPEAIVYHAGSGTSGSRYNHFKITQSAKNNIYVIYKNMPILQILINLPLLLAGILIKATFFTLKGHGKDYVSGIVNGFKLCKNNKDQKIKVNISKFSNYFMIQIELWVNLLRKSFDF